MKHTPTPWHVDTLGKIRCENDDRKGFIADVGDGRYYGSIPRKEEICLANAAHIVKCVNMHDELVEALKTSLKIIAKAPVNWGNESNESIIQASAILKKAEL